MINRSLIRIKVVQMLYAYLLTRTDFKIESRPEDADTSNDRSFGYQVYLDMLLLLLEITGNDTHRISTRAAVIADKKMAKSRLGASLSGNTTIRDIIFREGTDIDVLRPLAQALHDKVVASAAFSDYSRRRNPSLDEEVQMWTAVFPTVIVKDPALQRALRELPGFTVKGMEAGVNALMRTLRSYAEIRGDYHRALDELDKSLNKAYDLYISIFGLIIELTREQERRLETAKEKHLATAEERNPNTRFIDNAFVARLMHDDELTKRLKDTGITWDTQISLINNLLKAITESQIYADYMAALTTDYNADADLWRNILRNIVFTNDEFAEALEDKSIYWNDDLQIMGTFVLKTIKQSQGDDPREPLPLLPRYKDEEDARFGAELFSDTVAHREEYRSYIDRFINTGNWDPERLAFMDLVIMMTAISELLNFPKIPIAVTMNEYIEIANDYSTGKSGQFVNAILYKVTDMLRQNGNFFK